MLWLPFHRNNYAKRLIDKTLGAWCLTYALGRGMQEETVNPSRSPDSRRVRVPAPSHNASAFSTLSPIYTKQGSREDLQLLLAFSALHGQAGREVKCPPLSDGSSALVLEPKSQFSLDEKLQIISEHAMSITGADGIAIALAEDKAIATRANAGSVCPAMRESIDRNSGFSGACLRTGETLLCNDSETDARVNRQACRQLGARSMIAVPLHGTQGVIGLIQAFSKLAFGFEETDVQCMGELAKLVSSVLTPEDEARLTNLPETIALELDSLPGSNANLSPPALTKGEVIEIHDRSSLQRTRTPLARTASSHHEPRFEKENVFEIEQRLRLKAMAQPISVSPTSRSKLFLLLAAITIAGVLLAGYWFKMRTPHASGASNSGTNNAKSTDLTSSPSRPEPEAVNPASVRSEASFQPLPIAHSRMTLRQLATCPKITGIEHWSVSGSTTVVIDLEGQVDYEEHRLADPDRIFFDLHPAQLAPGLAGKSVRLGDEIVKRIRVGQPEPGVTRIVLETKIQSSPSVRLESNPYRLVVELRKASH